MKSVASYGTKGKERIEERFQAADRIQLSSCDQKICLMPNKYGLKLSILNRSLIIT